jgi:integrase
MAKIIRGHGEGSIYQRSSGSWRAQLSIRGKRHGKTFKHKADALAWLREMQNQLDLGYDIQEGNLTLEKYLPQWLDRRKTSLSPSTVYQYGQIMRDHIIPHIGEIRLKDLRLDRIERLYSDLLDSNIGVRTIRLTHAVLHNALNKAIKYGLIVRNPAQGADLPEYSHSEMHVLDASQVNQFLVAAQNSQYKALYYLAIHTGMRQGELFGLKWTDIQWQTGVMYVQRQVKWVPGQGWGFKDTKTKSGRRTIKLGEGTLQVLRLHREQQATNKVVAGDRWKEHGLVFPSLVGTPSNPSNLRKDFLKFLQEAGLHKIRFHDLRHTAASLMLNNGVPPIVVSKILGHSKPSITLDVYGHLYQEMQTDAAKIMDDLLTPIKLDMKEVGTRYAVKGENETRIPK